MKHLKEQQPQENQMTDKQVLYYTLTDEAPLFASFSLLPILEHFLASANIKIETKNISLAARILSVFPDCLEEHQKMTDDLKQLADLTNKKGNLIIKLPNISATVLQLKQAIKELQQAGFKIPDYPDVADNKQQVLVRYQQVLGSAVNPVLRQGNSERRIPKSLKNYAKSYPHYMGQWSKDSQTTVLSMSKGDFYETEQSLTLSENKQIRIVLTTNNNQQIVLKNNIQLHAGDVIDAALMKKSELLAYYQQAFEQAKKQGLLLSLHLKATMMKVSDPNIFAAALDTYYPEIYQVHARELKQAGITAQSGLNDLLTNLNKLPQQTQNEIHACLAQKTKQSAWAMVDSAHGISNLHQNNYLIVDASMPSMIRNSGKMWNVQGELQDTLALIPDRCYADIYRQTIENCKQQGAFDPTTMGTVVNIGLMAGKAEEYGSHDKTFILQQNGKIEVLDAQDNNLFTYEVEKGDIWRLCCTNTEAIDSWISLAFERAEQMQLPCIFWLDEQRAHDRQLIAKIKPRLAQQKNNNIQLLNLSEATTSTLRHLRVGEDSIAATGNVLRDYLTDLFPIMELGTSAKMLSMVAQLSSSKMFETGSGGSAPMHVEQLLKENHLRWDSMGEYLAVEAALKELSQSQNDSIMEVFAQTMASAIDKILQKNRSPGRHKGELDTRASHYYLALYWAEALASQEKIITIQQKFKPIALQLQQHQREILEQLNAIDSDVVDIDAYYVADEAKYRALMRPSKQFNAIIESI